MESSGSAPHSSSDAGRSDGLTRLERAVLRMMIDGDLPVLQVLKQQLAAATVARRELTGVGFYTHLEVPPTCERADLPPRVHFGDVHASMPGLQHGAGFVLFIEAGRLEVLEGYTYDEPWPASTDEFTLAYHPLPRDLSRLV